MTLGTTCAAALWGAAMVGCIAPLARARPVGSPRPVFACSLGRKSVSVTAMGDQFIYAFGTPSHLELSIVASAARKNIFYREDRYAGMEHQLRFVNGPYSYVVYNMEGNAETGARSISGLVVTKGSKVIADMACSRYAEFSADFDYYSLPQDTKDHSAM